VLDGVAVIDCCDTVGNTAVVVGGPFDGVDVDVIGCCDTVENTVGGTVAVVVLVANAVAVVIVAKLVAFVAASAVDTDVVKLVVCSIISASASVTKNKHKPNYVQTSFQHQESLQRCNEDLISLSQKNYAALREKGHKDCGVLTTRQSTNAINVKVGETTRDTDLSETTANLQLVLIRQPDYRSSSAPTIDILAKFSNKNNIEQYYPRMHVVADAQLHHVCGHDVVNKSSRSPVADTVMRNWNKVVIQPESALCTLSGELPAETYTFTSDPTIKFLIVVNRGSSAVDATNQSQSQPLPAPPVESFTTANEISQQGYHGGLFTQ
jgi:hypothetical protein